MNTHQQFSREGEGTEWSLADVLAVAHDADLSNVRAQEIASALRSVARALGRPLELIPADPRRLSARLNEVAPLAIGVSRRRWNNVRSLAGFYWRLGFGD
jgi:hypothetical protein